MKRPLLMVSSFIHCFSVLHTIWVFSYLCNDVVERPEKSKIRYITECDKLHLIKLQWLAYYHTLKPRHNKQNYRLLYHGFRNKTFIVTLKNAIAQARDVTSKALWLSYHLGSIIFNVNERDSCYNYISAGINIPFIYFERLHIWRLHAERN